MVKFFRFFFVFLFVACVGTISGPKYPSEAQVEDIIWKDVYGRTDTPPQIQWKTGLSLDCGEGGGWNIETTWDYNTRKDTGIKHLFCIAGLTISDTLVQIARSSKVAYSQTALAHEFGHVMLSRQGKDSDIYHIGPLFASGGLVDQANARLRDLGL